MGTGGLLGKTPGGKLIGKGLKDLPDGLPAKGVLQSTTGLKEEKKKKQAQSLATRQPRQSSRQSLGGS